MMSRVGASIARMSSGGQAKGSPSSCFNLATSVGKSSGLGATRVYSSSKGVPDGDLKGDTASHAVAEDVGFFDLEMTQQRHRPPSVRKSVGTGDLLEHPAAV